MSAGKFDTVAHFFVQGDPKAQPRPRFFRGHVYNPRTADEWRQAVEVAARAEWKDRDKLDAPVSLALAVLLPRPKRKVASEWQTARPDLDNLVKAVMDALSAAGVWRDDSLVVSLTATKGYSQGEGKAGCFVQIGRWTE